MKRKNRNEIIQRAGELVHEQLNMSHEDDAVRFSYEDLGRTIIKCYPQLEDYNHNESIACEIIDIAIQNTKVFVEFDDVEFNKQVDKYLKGVKVK